MIDSLSADGLTCVRGGRVVFRDVSISLRAGQTLSVEGANGSGKTSLLRVIAGFIAPERGTVRLTTGDGKEIDGDERGHLIGWLGHKDGAKAQMTPRETLRFFAAYEGGDANVDAALVNVGLTRARDLPSQYLSAGQKKRLALARLISSNRPLWLLDEPLAALDTAGRALVTQMIGQHCASGGMALVATHEPLGLDCETLQLRGAA